MCWYTCISNMVTVLYVTCRSATAHMFCYRDICFLNHIMYILVYNVYNYMLACPCGINIIGLHEDTPTCIQELC